MSIWHRGNATSSRCVRCDDATRDGDRAGAGADPPQTLSGAQERVVAPGATVEKLAGGFAFTEGPTCDADGNVLFTDQPNDRILKWSTDGRLSTFLQPAGRANGMYFAPGGESDRLRRREDGPVVHRAGRQDHVLLDAYGGRALNGPNDVWVRPDGALYFTDPFYPRPWWTHDAMPQDGQHVYFLSADRQRLVRVITDLTKPNGIIGTPDGRSLFVSDIEANRTYRYDIARDGNLPARPSSSSRAPTG